MWSPFSTAKRSQLPGSDQNGTGADEAAVPASHAEIHDSLARPKLRAALAADARRESPARGEIERGSPTPG